MDVAPGPVLGGARLCETREISRRPLREIPQRLAGAGHGCRAENRGATVTAMELRNMRMVVQRAPIVPCFSRTAADTGRVARAIARHDAVIAAGAMALTLAHRDHGRDQMRRHGRPASLPLNVIPIEDGPHAR